MSDKQHGLDQDAVSHEDQELHGEGAQAEAWQEDQPPVDDFHDQAESEAAAAEVEEIDPAAEEAAPAPKSGMKVMVGALAVGAVLLGGLLYLQFGTAATPTPLAMPISQVMQLGQQNGATQKSVAPLPPPVAPASVNNEVNIVDPGSTPKTGVADMANIYAAGHASDVDNAVAIPSPQSSSAEEQQPVPPVANADPANLTPPSVPEPIKDTPPAKLVAPVQPEPKQAAVVVPSHVPSLEPAKAVVAEIPAPPAVFTPTPIVSVPVAATNAAAEKRMNDMATKLDALQKSVDKVVQQASLIGSRIDAVVNKAAATSIPTLANPAFETRLEQLERKLAALSSKAEPRKIVQEPKVPQIDPDSAIAAPVASPDTSSVKAAEPEMQVSAVKSVKKVRAAVAKPVTHAKKAQTAVAQSKAAVQAWVLRAATPDAAWIAKDATSPNLTKVQVGDNIEGIGQVQSISQRGDNWIVIGSKLTLR